MKSIRQSNIQLNEEIEELYDLYKKKIRSDVSIETLPTDFSYYNLNRTQLEEPNSSTGFQINGKNVSKLTLIVESGGGLNCALVIKYNNGTREAIPLKDLMASSLAKKFIDSGAEKEKMFARRSHGKNIDWEKATAGEVYQQQAEDTVEFYNQLYNKIINSIVSIIDTKKKSPMIIVDGGCGDRGELLFKIENELQVNNIAEHVKLMGFDFNKENVRKCNDVKSSHVGTNCDFVTGDLMLTKDVINTWENDYDIEKDTPIILTLSGSLTRLVLKDGFQGLAALKNIALQGNVEYLVGGGVGEPLMNNYMMKKIGYKKIEVNDETAGKFFCYTKMNKEEILSHRKSKLNKYSILDLSLCPNPEEMFDQLIKYLHLADKPVTIDLSFTDLTADLIDKISRFAKDNKNLNLVFWHNDADQIFKFHQAFVKNQATGLNVASLKLVDDEGYLMSSRLFFSSPHSQSSENHIPDGLTGDDIQLQMMKILSLNVTQYEFAKVLISNYVNNLIDPLNDDDTVIQESLRNAVTEHDREVFYRKREKEFESGKESWVQDLPKAPAMSIMTHLGSELAFKPAASLRYDNALIMSRDHMKKLPKVVDSYISLLEKKIFDNGEIKHLPILIELLQTGIRVDHSVNGAATLQAFGNSLLKEIELYHRLANHPLYAQSFNVDLMKALAQRRLVECKPLLSEKEYVSAKARIDDLLVKHQRYDERVTKQSIEELGGLIKTLGEGLSQGKLTLKVSGNQGQELERQQDLQTLKRAQDLQEIIWENFKGMVQDVPKEKLKNIEEDVFFLTSKLLSIEEGIEQAHSKRVGDTNRFYAPKYKPGGLETPLNKHMQMLSYCMKNLRYNRAMNDNTILTPEEYEKRRNDFLQKGVKPRK